MDKLLNTEVLSPARFARQITDAATAVSVLTGQEIRDQGLRTLAEVLDQMRGLHISSGLTYSYLGARGLGGRGSLAGRVMLLIDGIPAVDNLYDQLFIGHDSIVDPSLIERIEYAPGSGSAMYGHNAFLGVVNVLTRRGRDLGGWEASASLGANAERQLRLSHGQRLANGAEWLASLTLRRDDGLPTSEIGHQPWPGAGLAAQWLFKGSWQGWTAQAMGMRHAVSTQYGATEKDKFIDASSFVSIANDRSLGAGWRSSVRLQAGSHLYRYNYDADDWSNHMRLRGTWWEIDTQAGYEGFADHAWIIGARWRQDPLMRYQRLATAYRDAASWYVQRQGPSLSVEDRWRISDSLHATLGLRLENRNGEGWAASPRNSLVWAVTDRLDLKWSQGRATRRASLKEEDFGDAPVTQGERVHTRELGVEYRGPALRWLATAYQYQMSHLILPDEGVQGLRGRGLELEGEWQSAGWRLRASHAWQRSRDDQGRTLTSSPQRVGKLQASMPLAGERWRVSASLRHASSMTTTSGGQVPADTRLDVTLVAKRWLGDLDLRLGWRNLNDSRAHGQDESFADDPAWQGRRNRHAWIELSGHFQ